MFAPACSPACPCFMLAQREETVGANPDLFNFKAPDKPTGAGCQSPKHAGTAELPGVHGNSASC